MEFERSPERALVHYESGVRIGELSLPAGFEGLLVFVWGRLFDRPFLRCLHSYGLCQPPLLHVLPGEFEQDCFRFVGSSDYMHAAKPLKLSERSHECAKKRSLLWRAWRESNPRPTD